MTFWKAFVELFQAPKVPQGWTDDMSVDLPDGVRADDIAQLGVEHLSQDGPFDALVTMLCEKGLSREEAEIAAERIAAGMTRAFMPNPAAAPNGRKDPIGRAAYDIVRARPDVS